ncbi:hypothetical protein RJT34_14331 [Clitoria ternatea]|uniref:Uncharacterized protein n=1 Tax=Clitoria ternatea TaxID=43366 RepID=A0AAN9PL09_CLITE
MGVASAVFVCLNVLLLCMVCSSGRVLISEENCPNLDGCMELVGKPQEPAACLSTVDASGLSDTQLDMCLCRKISDNYPKMDPCVVVGWIITAMGRDATGHHCR